ncbi:MAG: c-type cytochrome [Alphaproteobacteria bacterium]|nr:c-type cytochrome [Alphaproteobacteria bacterium]MBL6936461.1 c-type cytochrome [Alphaproteobacteria bacterium]MBL7098488.1 c-type cytochrome [Alphaproteobacteria bacterium]
MRGIAIALTLIASFATAQGAGNIAHGRAKAMQYCSACHKVTATQPQPPEVFDREADDHIQAPPFTTVAAKYATNEAGLRAFVHLPQYPMPAQELSPTDLSDLSAYILSLNNPKK